MGDLLCVLLESWFDRNSYPRQEGGDSSCHYTLPKEDEEGWKGEGGAPREDRPSFVRLQKTQRPKVQHGEVQLQDPTRTHLHRKPTNEARQEYKQEIPRKETLLHL